MFEVKVIAGEYKGRTVNVYSMKKAIEEFGEANLDKSSFKEYIPSIVEYTASTGVVSACYDDGSSKDIIDTGGDQEKAEATAAKLNAKL